MQKEAKLTREQVFFFSFIGILGNIVYIHTWIDNDTDRAAWVAVLLGILAVIPFAVWLLYLSKHNPEATIFDTLQDGLGKPVCWLICIAFIAVNICLAITHLNMYTELLKVFFMQNTPPQVIMFIILLISFLIVNSDITSTGRLIEILTVIGLLNYFASFIFAFPKMIHLEYIYPIFDTSFLGVVKGVIFIAGSASELLFFLMVVARNIPDPFKHKKWVLSGIGAAAIVFSFAIFVIMAMMSPELAKRIAFGGVNAARLITIGSYVNGLEVFVMGTYQFLAFGEIIMCLYCCWISSKKIFGESKPCLQLTAFSIAVFIAAIMLGTYDKAYALAVFCAEYIIIPLSLLILVLTSISTKIKAKRARGDST